jgi:hypothetical protein
MNFLVRCSNRDCKQLLVVQTVQQFENLVFEEMAKLVVCPVCKQKTALTLEIKKAEESSNGRR